MYLILILLFILGGQFSLIVRPNLTRGELLGIAFPFGLGLWSAILFLFDNVGFAINNKSILLSSCILLFVIFSVLIWNRTNETDITFPKLDIRSALTPYLEDPKAINPFYVTMLMFVLFITFVIVSKTLYWPILNYDSIDGYDLIAKLIGSEGQYNNLVFSTENFHCSFFLSTIACTCLVYWLYF